MLLLISSSPMYHNLIHIFSQLFRQRRWGFLKRQRLKVRSRWVVTMGVEGIASLSAFPRVDAQASSQTTSGAIGMTRHPLSTLKTV